MSQVDFKAIPEPVMRALDAAANVANEIDHAPCPVCESHDTDVHGEFCVFGELWAALNASEMEGFWPALRDRRRRAPPRPFTPTLEQSADRVFTQYARALEGMAKGAGDE